SPAEGGRGMAAKRSAITPAAPSSAAFVGNMASLPSRTERGFDDRERALAADIVDRPHAKHRMQLLGRHLHWSGRRSGPRRRLWERRRPRGVERDVALDLLHDLMD